MKKAKRKVEVAPEVAPKVDDDVMDTSPPLAAEAPPALEEPTKTPRRFRCIYPARMSPPGEQARCQGEGFVEWTGPASRQLGARFQERKRRLRCSECGRTWYSREVVED